MDARRVGDAEDEARRWSHVALGVLGASAWLVTTDGCHRVAGEPPGTMTADDLAAVAEGASEELSGSAIGHVVRMVPRTIGETVVERAAIAVTGEHGDEALLVVVRVAPDQGAGTATTDDLAEIRARVETWAASRTSGGLTSRELDIVTLLTLGHRLSSIAGLLFLSRHTVRNHLKAVFRKVGISSQAALIDDFRRSGPTAPASTTPAG